MHLIKSTLDFLIVFFWAALFFVFLTWIRLDDAHPIKGDAVEAISKLLSNTAEGVVSYRYEGENLIMMVGETALYVPDYAIYFLEDTKGSYCKVWYQPDARLTKRYSTSIEDVQHYIKLTEVEC
jgi:hypothetical protein